MIKIYKNLLKKNKLYLQLFSFYSLSHIWIIFLSNSLFWDDWHLFITNPEQLDLYWKMLGAPIRGFMIKSLFPFGFYSFRFITFIVIFINGVLLDKILKRIEIFNENNRFIICLIFLIAPFYIDRITIICFPYTLCTFLFFSAWYLRPQKKFLSFVLFIISFSTNSLLVFYALPNLENFYTNYSLERKSILRFLKNNFIFLIVPFLYFLLKKLLFKPYGLYEGYNNWFSLKSLFLTPFYQLIDTLDFKTSFVLILPIIVMIFSYVFYKYIPLKASKTDSKYSRLIFIIGIFSLFFGLFPYWILNHIPSFGREWMSRHQLLMPLGISLITSSVLSKFDLSSRRVFLALIVSISLIINVSNYFDLIKDYKKQIEITNVMSNYRIRDNIDVIIFDDQTKSFNAFNRSYRYYEWQGIINNAYPNKKEIIALNSINNLEFLNNLFNGKCQKIYGYKRINLPEKINVSKIRISKQENLTNASFLHKFFNLIFYKDFHNGYQIQETEFGQIKRNDLFEKSSNEWTTKNSNNFKCMID